MSIAARSISSPLAGEEGCAEGVGGRGVASRQATQKSLTELQSRHELLKKRARFMRANPTDAERKLWYILRDKRLSGYKFNRQVILDWYIVDFVNFEQRFIIEADGSQHADNKYDEQRDAYLKDQGFNVMRFWNSEALKETKAVAETIWCALQSPPPLPSAALRLPPSPARGEGLESSANA